MTHLQRRTAAVVDSGRRSVGFISRKSAGGGHGSNSEQPKESFFHLVILDKQVHKE